MRKRIAFSLIAVFFISLVFFQGCGKKEEDDVIKIGAILPLTGTASEFGLGNKNGSELALEKANSEGGINGKKIQIIYEDSKNEPKTGINSFYKLTASHELNALFVCMSSVSMAIKPLAEENSLLTFCVAAAPDLTKDAKYIFRLLPTTTLQAKKLAEFIFHQMNKDRKLSLFYIQDDFGNSFKESFYAAAEENGLNIVSENEFAKDGTNFRNIILRALNAAPEAIVLGGYGSSLGILIKQLREAGYDGPIYGTPDMGYPKVLNVVQDNLGDAYIIDFDVDKSSEKMISFIEKYKNAFNSEPSMDAIIGYDGLNILLEAQRRFEAKKYDNLRKSLLSIEKYNGLTGEIEILESGDIIFPLKLRKL